MCLSGLNSHCKKVKFINGASCDHCGYRSDRPCHYFFRFPAFVDHLLDLFMAAMLLVVSMYHTFTHCQNKNCAKTFLDVLLIGTRCLAVGTHIYWHAATLVFAVHDYRKCDK